MLRKQFFIILHYINRGLVIFWTNKSHTYINRWLVNFCPILFWNLYQHVSGQFLTLISKGIWSFFFCQGLTIVSICVWSIFSCLLLIYYQKVSGQFFLSLNVLSIFSLSMSFTSYTRFLVNVCPFSVNINRCQGSSQYLSNYFITHTYTNRSLVNPCSTIVSLTLTST